MNKGWQKQKLHFLVTRLTNGYVGQTKNIYQVSGVPYLLARHVKNNVLTFDGRTYVSDQFNLKNKKSILKQGDVLLVQSGHIGHSAVVPKEHEGHNCHAMIVMTPRTNFITGEFLSLYFLSPFMQQQFESLKTGSTIKHLNCKVVREVEIPLPSLSEQKRIVAILNEAFAAIAKAKANVEKNLQNTKELFECYLQNVFDTKGEGWEEKRLCGAFEIKPSKGEVKEKLKETDMVSFLPMEDLDVLAYDIAPVKERKLKEVIGSYTYFADNDVLLAKITPCFENGKLGIARNLINGVGFGSSEYLVFRSNGSVNPEYLYYFLSRNQFREEGSKRMTGAVGHKRVSKEFVEGYILPFPKSLKMQKDIVDIIDSLSKETRKLQSLYERRIISLEELKKSLLQKAFTGELTAASKSLAS